MPLTVPDFVLRWKIAGNQTERQVYQEHFRDICALIGQPTPVEHDPEGDAYCFERHVAKNKGGKGLPTCGSAVTSPGSTTQDKQDVRLQARSTLEALQQSSATHRTSQEVPQTCLSQRLSHSQTPQESQTASPLPVTRIPRSRVFSIQLRTTPSGALHPGEYSFPVSVSNILDLIRAIDLPGIRGVGARNSHERRSPSFVCERQYQACQAVRVHADETGNQVCEVVSGRASLGTCHGFGSGSCFRHAWLLSICRP